MAARASAAALVAASVRSAATAGLIDSASRRSAIRSRSTRSVMWSASPSTSRGERRGSAAITAATAARTFADLTACGLRPPCA
jgi:hypothetical protein